MRSFKTAFAVAATLAAFGASAPRARAAVMPYTQIDQNRVIEVSVSARSGSNPTLVTDGAREESNAIGSFSRSMQYAVSAQDPPPDFPNAGIAAGTAQQEVHFGQDTIFGTLSETAHVSHTGGKSNVLSNTEFTTHFTVAQDTPFTLTGQISMSSGGLGTVGRFDEVFILSGQGPEPGQTESFKMIGISGGNGGGTYPLTASGTFHPGWVYSLNVQLQGGKSTEGGVGAQKEADGRADFVLTVPEPAGVTLVAMAAGLTLLPRCRRRAAAAPAA